MNLSHLHPQLKKDNRGASLVTVMVVTSIIIVMVTVLLSVVLLNYFMKYQNKESQENFYDAESAMEQVRMGLVTEVSKAAGTAYAYTLTHYEDLAVEGREKEFQKKFSQELTEQLKGTQPNTYRVSLLESYLRGQKATGENDVGARLETPDDGVTNYLNDMQLEVGQRCLVLKNVTVSYLDEKDNYTQITTDIDINYPDIDFSNASAMENILCYGLIAGEGFVKEGGDTKINGNAFLGTGAATVKNFGQVSFQKEGNARGYVIGANLDIDRNAGVTMNHTENWFKNIIITSSSYEAKNSSSYLQNDLSINGVASSAILSGELFAYGNPQALRESESREFMEDIFGQIQGNEADFSSSIILNGSSKTEGKATLDLSEVTKLLIGGTAYVDTGRNRSHYGSGENTSQNAGMSNQIQNSSSSIKTGQSVMTTSDQRAYLIPGNLIGEGLENGGSNPMPAGTLSKLKQEIMSQKGYDREEQIQDEDLINFDGVVEGTGVSLRSLGVSDYDLAAIQVPAMGTMYYFFMKFESQTKQNEFVQKYYSSMANYNKLTDNINYYGAGGVLMPSKSGDPFRFYLQGNALATNGSSLLISDTLRDSTIEDATKMEIVEQEKAYADSYVALLCNLTKDYTSLSTEQKSNSLFSNLVEKDAINGADKYYVSTNGIGALVTQNDVTVTQADQGLSHVKDANGAIHEDAKISLIISKGDVTVDRNFEGLILCQGTITVTNSCRQISSNATAVATVLNSSDVEKNSKPTDYLKHPSNYFVGGVDGTEEADGAVNLSELVCYNNWEKR